MKIKIILLIIFNSLLYSQYDNDLFNFNTNIFNENINNNEEAKIIFSLKTNDNKLIVNADIPENYYAYLESSIANKIKFYADNKEINTEYPKGEIYHNDIIIKGHQEFILKDIENIKFINFIIANYQLCSQKDNICLPPQSEIIYGANNINDIENIIEKNRNESINENILNNNIFITLTIIFASGLASIFLPCSYPLLSITVSIFANSKKSNIKSNMLYSLFFSLGIVSTYTILGAAVSIAGFVFNKTILFGSIGYNPIVLTILILFFLYFAFSMAGFYEIRTPNFSQSAKLKIFSKNNNPLISKYITGLLTGISAAPCSAPIIAFILEIGFLNPLFSIFYMFIYALGFSSILFILGSFSSLIAKMPKSGKWTVYIKHIFTFLMLLICFYYLNILFKILGFNKTSYLFADLSIIIFAVFVYIFVFIIKKRNLILDKFEIKIFASVFILALIIGTANGFIKSKLETDSIAFEDALLLSKQENKYILIDFSAVWCANCYELKEKIFNNEELKKLIEDNLIFIEVDVDKRKDIAKEFQIKWLPYIIITDKDKNILYTKNSFSSFDEKTANEIKNDIENIIKKYY